MDLAKVEEECKMLVEHIKRLGEKKDGKHVTTFGALFNDREVEGYFEALVGTLRAAKKRKMIHFEGQMLMSPKDDKVEVSCPATVEEEPAAAPAEPAAAPAETPAEPAAAEPA
eukprot:gnl/TRDRNA2_/TRDRNA2_191607_c0_seq1.p2 gnl/TRDRNA2_/TRDRNA2_191607_c0~~gnl/TRDRNA2_/TRDRNA2_191607_c0_seq1.p2  ORF type:complete len:113 (-),score=39.26 gnl/TRDRNA2_/TRDRNA2_191607_c0_seq1:65-403(-)